MARADLEWAAGEGLIAEGQVEPLWQALASRMPVAGAAPAPAPTVQGTGRQRFDLVHCAYYFGALLVISAMGWFMTLGWESLGGGGVFLVAMAYATVFALAGWTLWFRQGLRVPGGLLITLAVWMLGPRPGPTGGHACLVDPRTG